MNFNLQEKSEYCLKFAQNNLIIISFIVVDVIFLLWLNKWRNRKYEKAKQGLLIKVLIGITINVMIWLIYHYGFAT